MVKNNNLADWTLVGLALIILALVVFQAVNKQQYMKQYDLQGIKLDSNFVEQTIKGMENINSKAFVLCDIKQEKCLQIVRVK